MKKLEHGISNDALEILIEEMLSLEKIEYARAFVDTRPLTLDEKKCPIRPMDSYRVLGAKELVEMLFESWKELRNEKT